MLFVHGSVGPGAWAPILPELSGFRCLVVERPGWGMSSAVDFAKHEYKTVVADVLRGTVDALGLDRVDVVSGSIGNVWALRLAAGHPSRVAGHPSRVGRIVLMSGAPLLPEVRVPRIIRVLASPIGAVMVRLPPTPGMERTQLRQNGHEASLAAGRIPDEFIEWRTALSGRPTLCVTSATWPRPW